MHICPTRFKLKRAAWNCPIEMFVGGFFLIFLAKHDIFNFNRKNISQSKQKSNSNPNHNG